MQGRAVKRIYFDESGQTGTHLLDAAQPYFTLGSTDVDEVEAAEILDACFTNRQGEELKSQAILKRPRGRRQFLDFAREVGKRPGRFCVAKIGKRHALVSKMVDHLVEPLLRAQGYDFYANDYAAKFANSASYVFGHLLDRQEADGLLGLYNAFAREPDRERLRALHTSLEAASMMAPHGSEFTLGLMEDGAKYFETVQVLADFDDANEIHVTAAVECMGYWQSQGPGPFEVVHDESKHFFARSVRWEAITNPELEPVSFTTGNKTLKLPIPVVSTVGARSHESASLQLCDLVAGLVSRASAPNHPPEFREFLGAVIDAGFGEMTIFPVDAGTDFVSGPPERSTGPDMVDRIAQAVRRQRKS